MNPQSSNLVPGSSAPRASVDSSVRIRGVELHWLPIETRVPLKFGTETLTSVTCARVCLHVEGPNGKISQGWGETPLSVQWAWPSAISYSERHDALKTFCHQLASAWADFSVSGHPLEIGYAFQRDVLPRVSDEFNRSRGDAEPLCYLAALVCCSAFDVALYDAYGNALGLPVYQTLGREFLKNDLSYFLTPSVDSEFNFKNTYPDQFVAASPKLRLPAWHLVGGLDPLWDADLDSPIDDGEPVVLDDWIRRDGLKCLKVKLRGTDAEWDYRRLEHVGQITLAHDVEALTADFNCTVTDPEYVINILKRLAKDHSEVYQRILYVEQPFPYDLEKHMIDVRTLASMKPLLMDESAHDWQHVQLGRSLGWNGVALKTCKTQTGALLSACWAQAHNMHLMVQDLTNPMLAQIPHLLLAAHLPTMMGVETNAMQFYPRASDLEAQIHPGVYRRRQGEVDLTSIQGSGFGYRLKEIGRQLPEPAASFGLD